MIASVLDTDILTLLQAGDAKVHAKLNSHPPQQVGITVISVEEQLSGWYTLIRKAKRIDRMAWAYQQLAKNVRSLSGLPIVDYDIPSINRYDALHLLKLNVRRNDLRIAAIALENNATVVTRNLRDFRQIPGLTIEDWSQ